MGRIAGELDRHNRVDNQKAWEALRNQGVAIVSPTEAELAGWKAAAAEARRSLEEDRQYSLDLMVSLRSLLEAFRASGPGGK